MRPYMEDRHTVVNSFQPRTSTGQAVQVRRRAGRWQGRAWTKQKRACRPGTPLKSLCALARLPLPTILI